VNNARVTGVGTTAACVRVPLRDGAHAHGVAPPGRFKFRIIVYRSPSGAATVAPIQPLTGRIPVPYLDPLLFVHIAAPRVRAIWSQFIVCDALYARSQSRLSATSQVDH